MSTTKGPRNQGVASRTINKSEIKLVILIAHLRRQREGRPVVARRASEKFKYEGGRRMIPTHWMRNHILIVCASVVVAVKDSVEKIITKQNIIQAKDRATRSRRLKDNPYNKSEKAAIAIPAVNIWLIVLTMDTSPSTKLSNDSLFIEKYKNRRMLFHGYQKNHP